MELVVQLKKGLVFIEVLGGTHQVKIKELFFTICDLTLRGRYSELPASFV